jgi:DNA-binding MarR family transcriptional regulator
MIDRLVRQRLLDRTENRLDRRRKAVAITASAKILLRKIGRARASEYELGLAPVAPELLAQMATLLGHVVAQLENGKKGNRGVVHSSRSGR